MCSKTFCKNVHSNVSRFECLRCQKQFGCKYNEPCSKCVMNCKFCATNFEKTQVFIYRPTIQIKISSFKVWKEIFEKKTDLKKHQKKCNQTVIMLYSFYTITAVVKRHPNRDVHKCILNIIFSLYILNCILFYIDFFSQFKIRMLKISFQKFNWFCITIFNLYHCEK